MEGNKRGILVTALLLALNSPYLGWNYNDPEKAVLGVALHSFEWVFVRVAPMLLIGAVAGVIMVVKRGR